MKGNGKEKGLCNTHYLAMLCDHSGFTAILFCDKVTDMTNQPSATLNMGVGFHILRNLEQAPSLCILKSVAVTYLAICTPCVKGHAGCHAQWQTSLWLHLKRHYGFWGIGCLWIMVTFQMAAFAFVAKTSVVFRHFFS